MSDLNETRAGSGQKPEPPAGQPAPPRPAQETAPHPRPAPSPPPPPVQIGGNVGGDVAGRDLNKELNAGRDIVGRDVVTNTTNVGFAVAAVQRLVLAVGALVAATAACFFLLGSITAAGIVVALNRPVNSNNPVAAQSFGANLAALRALPPGQPFEFAFTEEQISSYFHLVVESNALQGQITNGQVRLLDSGQLAVAGQASRLGGLGFATTFAWQKDKPGAPLRMTGAMLHIVPLGNSPLGWVPVPIAALRPIETMLNSLFGSVALTDVQPLGDGHAWDVTVVGH